MVVPLRFRRSPPFTLSFSYNDFLTGSGVTQFYGFMAEDSVGNDYRVTTSTVYSKEVSTSQVRNLDNTYSFDVPFAVPLVVDGDVIVQCCYFLQEVGSGPVYISCTVYLSIFHVNSSGVESQLDSTISEGLTFTGGPTSAADLLTASFAVSKKHFSIGEKFRLKVRVVTGNSSNGNSFCAFYHDPANRSAPAGYTSQLKLNIPFVNNF